MTEKLLTFLAGIAAGAAVAIGVERLTRPSEPTIHSGEEIPGRIRLERLRALGY